MENLKLSIKNIRWDYNFFLKYFKISSIGIEAISKNLAVKVNDNGECYLNDY